MCPEPSLNCPANAEYAVTKDESGLREAIVYFDKLGREIRAESEGFTSSGYKDIYQDTEYDQQGRVSRKSLPYFAGAQTYWTAFSYDVLDRVLTKTTPDGTVTQYEYQGLKTTIHADVNGQDQTTSQWKDVLGNLRKVQDNMGNVTAYEYDPFNNLIEMTDPAGNVTTVTYDQYGRKMSMDDPDMGHWEYDYNALGELIWQKNAKNQIVTMQYDKLGRMIERDEPEGTSTWSYDAAPGKGIGKLYKVTGPAGSGYEKVHSYDSLGRTQAVTTTILFEDYTLNYTYDNFSRLETIAYPTGFSTRNVYDGKGSLIRMENASTGIMYWELSDMNAHGQVTQEQVGNGLDTIRSYKPETGRLASIRTGSTASVQNWNYVYDSLGNLEERNENTLGFTETFQYDDLNRLTQASSSYHGSISYTYDAIGNITSKTGFGDYTYGPNYTGGNTYTCNGTELDLSSSTGGPHAATVVLNDTTCDLHKYRYDANGNMIEGDGRDITYSSFNKPIDISQGGQYSTFQYAPDRSRIVQTSSAGTTVYLGRSNSGSSYEKKTKDGVTSHIHYLYGGTGLIGTYTSRDNSTEDTRYFHKDYLGSIDVITDENGAVVERLSYSPFGERRSAPCNDGTCTLLSSVTLVGFTGHEHIDEVGLIHMNGRVYDPVLSRFLSAAPIIQAASNTQNLNRYSYVLNNPLAAIDPSGYFIEDFLEPVGDFLDKWFPTIFMIAFTAVASMMHPAAGVTAAFSVGYASTESVEGGIVSALTALAFYAIGSYFDRLQNLSPAQRTGKVILHGAVGGLSSAARGGKFHQGFLAASGTQGFAQLGGFKAIGLDASSASSGPEYIYNATAAAAIGGTASVIGGGKFANGAVTGAFSRLFNDLWPWHNETPKEYDNRINAQFDKKINNVHEYYDSYYNDSIDIDLSVSVGSGKGWTVKKGIVTFEGDDISIGVGASYDGKYLGVKAKAKVEVLQAIRNISPLVEPSRNIAVSTLNKRRRQCLLYRNC